MPTRKGVMVSFHLFLFYSGVKCGSCYAQHTVKNEREIFTGAGVNHLTSGLLIYDKYSRISLHIRKSLLLYDFAPALFRIWLYMRKMFPYFFLTVRPPAHLWRKIFRINRHTWGVENDKKSHMSHAWIKFTKNRSVPSYRICCRYRLKGLTTNTVFSLLRTS
jgi:hypothetical protein